MEFVAVLSLVNGSIILLSFYPTLQLLSFVLKERRLFSEEKKFLNALLIGLFLLIFVIGCINLWIYVMQFFEIESRMLVARIRTLITNITFFILTWCLYLVVKKV